MGGPKKRKGEATEINVCHIGTNGPEAHTWHVLVPEVQVV